MQTMMKSTNTQMARFHTFPARRGSYSATYRGWIRAFGKNILTITMMMADAHRDANVKAYKGLL